MNTGLNKIFRASAKRFAEKGLSEEQINLLLSPTPAEFLLTRIGARGMILTYVSDDYVWGVARSVFSSVSSEVKDRWVSDDGCYCVHVRVSVKFPDGSEEFHEAIGGQVPREGVEAGDVWKSAQSDAEKKAFSRFGICADVYAGISEKEQETTQQETTAQGKTTPSTTHASTTHASTAHASTAHTQSGKVATSEKPLSSTAERHKLFETAGKMLGREKWLALGDEGRLRWLESKYKEYLDEAKPLNKMTADELRLLRACLEEEMR